MDSDSNLQTVNDYLLLTQESSIPTQCKQNGKKIIKKFRKRNTLQFMTKKGYKNWNVDCINQIRDYLTSIKTARKNIKCIGILSDQNVVTSNNINVVPPTPLDWDVLALQADIETYNYKDKYNTVYWCSTKIKDTKHFIINGSKLELFLRIVKNSKNWEDLIKNMNQTKLYCITQYMFSEPIGDYLQDVAFIQTSNSKSDKQEIASKISRECISKYQKISESKLGFTSNEEFDKKVKDFDNVFGKLSDAQKYKIFPKISLICPIMDTTQFFHSLYLFLKLDYPRDKLELVIVDDFDAEKKLKSVLPNDSRIRIVNITPATKSKESLSFVESKFSIGYKLNLGVKYASHDLVFHFFDAHHYYIDKFRDLIKYFLVSGANCIISKDKAIASKENGESYFTTMSSLSNMLYTKDFWKVYSFDEVATLDENYIVYNFIKHRTTTLKTLPFLYFSFESLQNCKQYIYENLQKLPFSLESNINSTYQESYKIAHTN